MTDRQISRKKQAFEALRREILGARLQVTLDNKRGLTSSAKVKALAEMNLPPASSAGAAGKNFVAVRSGGKDHTIRSARSGNMAGTGTAQGAHRAH